MAETHREKPRARHCYPYQIIRYSTICYLALLSGVVSFERNGTENVEEVILVVGGGVGGGSGSGSVVTITCASKLNRC